MRRARCLSTVPLYSGRVLSFEERLASDHLVSRRRDALCSTCVSAELHQQFDPNLCERPVSAAVSTAYSWASAAYELPSFVRRLRSSYRQRYPWCRSRSFYDPSQNVMSVPARACSTETEPDTEYSESEEVEAQDDESSEPEDMNDQPVSDTESVETEEDTDLEAEALRQMEPDDKFTRPSVTWGVLYSQEHRRIVRGVVLEFLKGEGISTAEIMDIELPTSVEVMKERLNFLRKLGLDNDDINIYPLMLGCSVRKNIVPVLKYLNKLGMARHFVPAFLRKYPMILHASVVIDILPVIYCLQGLDIDPVDIPNVLLRYPDLLSFRQEGTMSTSVAYLVSIGVRLRSVGRMLTETPEIMGMRTATVIKPKVEYLTSLGIPKTIVARILERRQQLLGYDLVHRMQHNVGLLLKAGVKEEAIPGVIAQYPELLGRIVEKELEEKSQWFREQLHVDSEGLARMIEKMPQVLFLKYAVAMERIKYLKSSQFSVKDIRVMVTRCPQILVLSIEENLELNLTFLVRDMKRSLKEVVEFPEYLTYSLETRIRLRHKAIVERGVKCSLAWLLNCSDLEFQKRLETEPVDRDGAGPLFVMGGFLPGRSEKEQEECHLSQEAKVAFV